MKCEIPGCRSKGKDKETDGYYQVYDGRTPTMNRPARMCKRCIEFAKKCGMTVTKIVEK